MPITQWLISSGKRIWRCLQDPPFSNEQKILLEVFANIQDGISILDKEYNILQVNPAMERWYAHALPLVNKKCYQAYHQRTIPCEVCPTKKTLATSQPAFEIVPLTGEGGQPIGSLELFTFPMFDRKSGALKGVIEVVRDISARVSTEQALQKSLQAQVSAEAQFRHLVEQSLVGICISQNQRLVYVNPKMAEMFKYTAEEMLAIPDLLDLVWSEDKLFMRKNLQRLMTGEPKIESSRWRGLRQDGNVIEIEAHFSVMNYKGQQAIFATMMDITEARRLEEQLRQSQKMEAVGRLAGGIAHDFNNLLMVITGYCELILGRPGEQNQAQPEIEEILKAAERGALLTRQLLAYSRRQVLHSVVLDLNHAIQNLQRMLKPFIGENIALVLELDEKVHSIKVDPGNLEQVIMNLVVNACDAMGPEGGRLTITTQNVSLDLETCKQIYEGYPGEFVCLTIRDTGKGMPPELLQTIFDPFFTTKEIGQGTGLGLAVVYGIVKQHEGCIQVSSQLGKGSELNIFFPAFLSEDVPALKKQPVLQWTGGGERILLVEDDEQVCEIVCQALERKGYHVFRANNAQAAAELFQQAQGNYDLIFTDVVLPDKNGVQLAEELQGLNPKIKILLTSGYIDYRNQWTSIQEKGYPFLQKPYTFGELIATILKIMRSERI